MEEGSRDSSWRYDQGTKAARYRARSLARTQREASMLQRLFEGLDLGHVLDAPCGAGRLEELLRAHGASWCGLDRSLAMLREARLAGATRLLRGSLDALPFEDAAFDTVVCFRFLHHLEARDQTEVLREVARVASSIVIVSAFTPYSLHGVRRRIRATLLRKRPSRHATALPRLDATMGQSGFCRTGFERDGLARDLYVARYERRSDAGVTARRAR